MESREFRSLKGLRVLVVDDNPISQRLYTHILLQWQVSTDIANSGKMAIEMLSKVKYDVILMDLMMPEMDGYDTTRAIRSLEGTYFRDLPIFAFSTCPDPERIMACKMNGLISKYPLDKEELYQTISSFLK